MVGRERRSAPTTLGGPHPPCRHSKLRRRSYEERRVYEKLKDFWATDLACPLEMGTRPQALYGIADSPVGLAAWLLDHNDADGQPAAAVTSALDRTTSATGELTRDEVLDNITLYWLTNTGVSASRLYWEYKGGFFNAKGVSIPVATTVFPGEQYQAPRSLGRAGLPQPHLLQRSRQGRPLRRLRTATALHRGGPRSVPLTAVARRSS
jgi:hypothetical protein